MRKLFLVILSLVLCLVITTSTAESTSSSLSRRIASSCTTSSMSQFEKAVALYDWLIDHTVYKGSTTNPYIVLKYGEASCGGYASAYRDLLAAVGIKAKTIDGKFCGLGHTWNLVFLNGKWYHVDARMGDHLGGADGRYRWFGMSNEQARLYYGFKGASANSYSSNYAYKTGKLNSSIDFVDNAIRARAATGDRLFVIDLTASGAPSELSDPFNRITVKNVLQYHQYEYPGVPDKAKATLTLSDNLLLVSIKVPTYHVKTLTRTVPMGINIVADRYTDFSTIKKIELGGNVVISPSYATQKRLYWKSNREKVAIVDQNGEVRIVGFGIAKVSASTTDGSKLSCNFVISVSRVEVKG